MVKASLYNFEKIGKYVLYIELGNTDSSKIMVIIMMPINEKLVIMFS